MSTVDEPAATVLAVRSGQCARLLGRDYSPGRPSIALGARERRRRSILARPAAEPWLHIGFDGVGGRGVHVVFDSAAAGARFQLLQAIVEDGQQ